MQTEVRITHQVPGPDFHPEAGKIDPDPKISLWTTKPGLLVGSKSDVCPVLRTSDLKAFSRSFSLDNKARATGRIEIRRLPGTNFHDGLVFVNHKLSEPQQPLGQTTARQMPSTIDHPPRSSGDLADTRCTKVSCRKEGSASLVPTRKPLWFEHSSLATICAPPPVEHH